MQTSIFIAQLYAIAFLAIGFGLLADSKYYCKAFDNMMKEPGVLYFGGVVSLVIGFLIITHHNVWQGWPTLVTIFGWIALLKGVSLLIFPQYMIRWTKNWFANKHFLPIWGLIIVMLGVVLGYFSFLA